MTSIFFINQLCRNGIKLFTFFSKQVVFLYLLLMDATYLQFFLVLGLIWLSWVLWHINHGRLFNAKSSLYTHIKYMIYFRWVLWHINHGRLCNAKSSLYTHIIYMIYFRWVLWHINHGRLCNAKSSLYLYINIYDLFSLGFMAYQPLNVI